jgi:hypothetical protein
VSPAPGVALFRGALEADFASSCLAAIDAHPAWHDGDEARSSAFDPYSSSLRALDVPGLDLGDLAASLLRGEIGELCRRGLGEALACDLDRCWVRRQYPIADRPPRHAPHAWHQDGALGFDFLAAAPTVDDEPLLAMRTCWIALTPCGRDAPGLEYVAAAPAGLLPLAALADDAVHARYRADRFVRPELRAGDALVFDGGVLHHTHVDATMRYARTSLEIRFFAADRLPARLRGDRFLPLT